MFREIFITCYLLAFKLTYILFKPLPVKNKIIFIVSFQENACFLYREMARLQQSAELVFLLKPEISKEFQKDIENHTVIPFGTFHLINWFKSIYHLSTAKVMVIDNYYGFLSAIKLKKGAECIQVWHAAGALKTFGLMDKSTLKRSPKAKRRFKKVYEKYNKIAVGSEKMAKIFMDAFAIGPQNLLRTGIPRTDFFYDRNEQETVKLNFYRKYPELKGKKLLLYAPTFRDSSLVNFKNHLDLEKMYKSLKHDYILIIKLHPAVKTNERYDELYPGFVYNLSMSKINDLLVMADLLITDYSSIPFEYALLKKPMIFFPYDLEFYQQERGILPDYEQVVPGPVVFKTDEIIQFVLNNHFDLNKIGEFSDVWNEYSNGKSSKKLVQYIVKQMGKGIS